MSSTFAEFGVHPRLVSTLNELGITEPFEIQSASIPPLLAGRDLCGRAPTGSGKTLAFGIPLVTRIARAAPGQPRGLILAPTRELAQQIQQALLPLCEAWGRRVLAVYGGVKMEPQLRALKRGIDILVACPGRLQDLVGQRAVKLDQVEVVVVDEADRMADMGFLPQVRRLLDLTPPTRQTALFSATLDSDVAVLTKDYQKDPERVEVGKAEPDVRDMEHRFWRVPAAKRVELCSQVVSGVGSAIVFCRTRHGSDRVARRLSAAGVPAASIHGGLAQGRRNRALAAFAEGKVQALVATDVAARGLHIDDVALIVHFDPPEDHKTYLHRSGRTARAGARGVVVSLVTGTQVGDSLALQKKLGLSPQVGDPELDELEQVGKVITLKPKLPWDDEPVRRYTPRKKQAGSGPVPRKASGKKASGKKGSGKKPSGKRKKPSKTSRKHARKEASRRSRAAVEKSPRGPAASR